MNMTPMIDVIFQLFIFFMVTLDLQNQQMDMGITLAMAPHGKPLGTLNPLTIHIDVSPKGRIYIAKTPLSLGGLRRILGKARSEYGKDVPIVIRSDKDTFHKSVKSIMDACSSEGFSTIFFAAIVEKQEE